MKNTLLILLMLIISLSLCLTSCGKGSGGEPSDENIPEGDGSLPEAEADHPDSALSSGLYDENNNLIASWAELVDDYGLDISSDVTEQDWYYSNTTLDYMFRNNAELAKGKKLVIDRSVKKIGHYAFYKCENLDSVFISGSVETIGGWSFLRCALKEINVDKSNGYYKSIDGNLYTKDGKTLMNYSIGKTDSEFIIPNGVTAIGTGAFSDCHSLTSLVIPDSVTTVSAFAFENCNGLTSVVFPDSVTEIGKSAMTNCGALTSVTIGKGVSSIGLYAFSSCYRLEEIKVSAENQQYRSIDGNLYTKDGKALIQYSIGKPDSQFVIPEGVTTLNEFSLFGCNITSVVIPKSVSAIGKSALFCYELTDIYYAADEELWAGISIDKSAILSPYSVNYTYNYTP